MAMEPLEWAGTELVLISIPMSLSTPDTWNTYAKFHRHRPSSLGTLGF